MKSCVQAVYVRAVRTRRAMSRVSGRTERGADDEVGGHLEGDDRYDRGVDSARPAYEEVEEGVGREGAGEPAQGRDEHCAGAEAPDRARGEEDLHEDVREAARTQDAADVQRAGGDASVGGATECGDACLSPSPPISMGVAYTRGTST